jgi:hypothetical protein
MLTNESENRIGSSILPTVWGMFSIGDWNQSLLEIHFSLARYEAKDINMDGGVWVRWLCPQGCFSLGCLNELADVDVDG